MQAHVTLNIQNPFFVLMNIIYRHNTLSIQTLGLFYNLVFSRENVPIMFSSSIFHISFFPYLIFLRAFTKSAMERLAPERQKHEVMTSNLDSFNTVSDRLGLFTSNSRMPLIFSKTCLFFISHVSLK